MLSTKKNVQKSSSMCRRSTKIRSFSLDRPLLYFSCVAFWACNLDTFRISPRFTDDGLLGCFANCLLVFQKQFPFFYPFFKPLKMPFKFTCTRTWSCSEKGLKISGLNKDSNPDLCGAGAVLHQLSYQANCEPVVMWLDYKPVYGEIDDDNTGLFHVFEIRVLNY